MDDENISIDGVQSIALLVALSVPVAYSCTSTSHGMRICNCIPDSRRRARRYTIVTVSTQYSTSIPVSFDCI